MLAFSEARVYYLYYHSHCTAFCLQWSRRQCKCLYSDATTSTVQQRTTSSPARIMPTGVLNVWFGHGCR